MRNLVRCRETAVEDQLRARHRLSKSARLASLEKKIETQIPELPEVLRETVKALQSMRGIALVTAATLATEVEQLGRFEHPRQLMSYGMSLPMNNGPTCRQFQARPRRRSHDITMADIVFVEILNTCFLDKVFFMTI